MEVSLMAPYVDSGDWATISNWSDFEFYSREVLGSSVGSSSSRTSPWQLSTPRKAGMRVADPVSLQTSIGTESNDSVRYRPLTGHDFLCDTAPLSFEESPTTKLETPVEDVISPSHPEVLAPDFSLDENYPISVVQHVTAARIQDHGIAYLTTTPCATEREHEITDFNLEDDILCTPIPGHDFRADLQARRFDGPPSPMELAFVDSPQAFFESCSPLALPSVDVPGTALNSPSTPFDMHATGNVGYFTRPDTPPSGHSTSSSSSSPSSSSATMTPVLKVSPQKDLGKPATLPRVQSSGSTRAAKENTKVTQVEVDHVAVGVHKCTIPGCKSERGFKRLEHLKRHQKTHHDKKGLKCRYCHKILFQVDRSDNYRQHVYLHATPDRKGKRTKFDVEALAEVTAWEEEKARTRKPSIAATKAIKLGNHRNAMK